jgi:ATP-dependent helicase HrpA
MSADPLTAPRHNFQFPGRADFKYNTRPVMNDPRINELRQLLPQALLPDWVRLGSRAARLFRDRLHPDKHDALLNRLLEQARDSVARRQLREAHVPAVSYAPELPITARKDEIVAAVRANQVVVIAGETGSGKTTQLPKMCLEAGLGIRAKIGCTQPRRVAALSISRRIAEELSVTWGREVGCKIRFDDRSSADTYIKLMTDGILLAEAQGDPQLSDYDAIIIDEAHERSLNIDFLLGHLKGLLARRTDLKLIITSATIDTQMFSRHFNNAPIIEVSGRMYPVEVIYQSQDSESEEQGDLNYVDAAVQAAERTVYESSFGDVLIFMPGERDIRETSDLLEGRLGRDAEIIPLFGRLSSGDQQRVFSPSSQRKIVIATNIAETSLTIPGIRYVIDAGLARISRYNPRTRTKRLPIEPVSQSNANQRKGRAGRVQDGICIRLYSEEDFNARPAFTQPEIQRANLAEVILRMKAFRLGDIETFPFVQPPTPAAIASGYALLQELGALDAQRNLTPLGDDLARLPIDPTLGRMLLQSQQEHTSRELLIIAAGLSIQDPRERPLDQKEAAAAAHKRFADPQSDFLALLNIWNAVHDEWEKLRGQSARRKFCRQNFLSYLRMREWQDLHAQLCDNLADLPLPAQRRESRGEGQDTFINQNAKLSAKGSVRLSPHPQSLSPSDGAREARRHPAYDAIHRSILSGLIGHVARREERNLYKAAGNRDVTMFPGSALYERGEKPIRGRDTKAQKYPPPKPKSNQPPWIVAGEIVETSQLFARAVAGIDPQWIYQLAPHCCKVAHQNPHWSVSAGRVLVEEIITLHGLEVVRRKVAYGNINPKDATAIFIRAALVEEDVVSPRSNRPEEAHSPRAESGDWKAEISESLRTSAAPEKKELPARYAFLAHNRSVRQKIENLQTRARHHGMIDLDQALVNFYAARIENVSSFHELNRALRDHVAAGILPAVEPGFQPGGKTVANTAASDSSPTTVPPHADPGGRMPDATGVPLNQRFLCAAEADLLGDLQLSFDANAFPDSVHIAEQPLALNYAYAPGEEWDGVTVQLPVDLARALSPAAVEWSVPGLRAEQVGEWLRSLPRTLRRELQPIEPKVAEIVRDLNPSGRSLRADLAKFLLQRYDITVPADAWREEAVPAHLRPRVEIVDHNRKTIAAGRNLEQLKPQLKATAPTAPRGDDAWQRAAAKWERIAVTTWVFGDLPEKIVVNDDAGRATLPRCPAEQQLSPTIYAWPGLTVEDGHVNLRLFRSAALARETSFEGVNKLIEIALQKDLAWLQKDLRALCHFDALYAPLGASDELQETAFANLLRHALPSAPLPALTQINFDTAVRETRERLVGLPSQIEARLNAILPLRQQIATKLGQAAATAPAPRPRTLNDLSQLGSPAKPAASKHPLAIELNGLLPPRFLEQITFDRLKELPRYLKALLTRLERAALNPQKDAERAAQLAPYAQVVAGFAAKPASVPEVRAMQEEFRWLVEEFKVSLFAQELGTAAPISAKRLDQKLEALHLL